MSEDLSEGEKGDMVGDMSSHGDSLRGGGRMNMPRINSIDALDAWAIHQKEKKLYIVLIRHARPSSFSLPPSVLSDIKYLHAVFMG